MLNRPPKPRVNFADGHIAADVAVYGAGDYAGEFYHPAAFAQGASFYEGEGVEGVEFRRGDTGTRAAEGLLSQH